jgi:uncharacterized SAM-dependent methyltransferase
MPLARTIQVEAGTRIMTEISRKFVPDRLADYLSCFGFEVEQLFTDAGRQFAVFLLRKEWHDDHHAD